MPHYLPSSSDRDTPDSATTCLPADESSSEMNDLKIFWGPEICRLEYLLHLLATGRIKDEVQANRA